MRRFTQITGLIELLGGRHHIHVLLGTNTGAHNGASSSHNTFTQRDTTQITTTPVKRTHRHSN
eukprot:564800-Prorocentrum_lima.AAC.1